LSSYQEEFEDEFCEFLHSADLYSKIANETSSAHRFQKLSFPDLYGVKGLYRTMEALYSRKFGVQRSVAMLTGRDQIDHRDSIKQG
jgi:hypothetical protein